MKRCGIVLVVACLALVACGKTEAPQGKSAVTPAEVKKEAREATSAAAQYARQERDEFVRSAEKEVDELKAKVVDLKKDAQAASGEAKTKLDQRVAVLESKWNAAQAKIVEIKGASGEAWKDMKEGFGSALSELNSAYDEAVGEFKSKPAK